MEEKEEKEDINKLILENKNKEHMKLEDIIKCDFNKEYIIPEYKIPNEIKKEIENNKKEEENQKKIYEDNKNNQNNDLIKDNNNNLQTVKDIIKKDEYDEEGAFVEVDIDENKAKKEEDNKKENNIEFEKVSVDDFKDIENGNDNEDEKYNEFN